MGHWRYVKDPKKTSVEKPGLWHDKVKQKAIELFMANGSITQTSRELNIPKSTLKLWRNSEWWKDQIRAKKEEELEVLDTKLSSAIDMAIESITDRMTNGDVHIDTKTGEVTKIPPKLRDLTVAFNTILDKRQILRKQPTKIVEQATTAVHLQKLADQFAEFVNGKVKKESQSELVEHVIEGETVELGEDGVYYIKDDN